MSLVVCCPHCLVSFSRSRAGYTTVRAGVRCLLATVFLVVISVVPHVEAQNHSESVESEGNQLLSQSMHILGGQRRPVARWYEAVRVAIVGPVSGSMSDEIRSIFNEISLLSGIPYSLIQHDVSTAEAYASALLQSPPYDLSVCDHSDPSLCANFVIVLASKAAMNKVTLALPMRAVFQQVTETRDDELLCFFSPGIKHSTEIVRSVVYVQSDIEETMQLTCLQEEIYQSFGLFDDYSDSQYFSFNNVVKEKQITVYDKQLLTSLYDNTFARGTPALPVAQQLVDYCVTGC